MRCARPRAMQWLTVTDARTVLDAVAGVELEPEQADAVGLLALVAGQDVEPGDGEGTWRIARCTTPDRIVSVHDPESRHVHKTVHAYRDGFKGHVAVEPQTGIVTACDLTAGNVGDAQAAPGLLAHESGDLDVLGDSAYSAGAFRAHLVERGSTAVVKPPPLQRVVPGGFSIDDFVVDLTTGTVTCPAQHTVAITRAGKAIFRPHCRGCPLRGRCTTSPRGRTLNIHPHHHLLAAVRRQAETPEFQAVYRHDRPLVERTLSWMVRRGRRVAYRGVARNRIWWSHRAAAVNLRRLLNLGLHRTPTGWALG